MAIVVGIDEAGYGPTLGPLVMSAVAFEVPDGQRETSIWDLLHTTVTGKPSRRDSRLLIADSKKVYTRSKGTALLEAGALSMLGTTGRRPESFRGLLKILSPHVADDLRSYPWYCQHDPALPWQCDAGAISTKINALQCEMEESGVRFAGAWSEVLPEGHFNRLVEKTRNKATALGGMTMRLLGRVATSHPDADLDFFIDKQGGRSAYGRTLMRSFERADLRIVKEDPHESTYELAAAPVVWRVAYVQKGEDHHLPIALGSMFSKYLRELFMSGFNGFWGDRVSGLRPTAGYYTDAQRFLKDITTEIDRLGVDRNLLVRRL